jgi:hypothetical protein
MNMTRFFMYAAMILSLGASATLGFNSRNANAKSVAEAQLSADGAFRDGLYLGRLAAQSGQTMHPAIGRWATDQDRAMFTAGYRRGYEGSGQ